jgi:hypothetical protein
MDAGTRLARRSALVYVFCCSVGSSTIGTFSSSDGCRYSFRDQSFLLPRDSWIGGRALADEEAMT